MSGENKIHGVDWRAFFQGLRKRRFQVDIVFVFCVIIIPTVITISGFTYYKTVGATLETTNTLVEKVTEAVIEKTTNYLKPAQVLAEVVPLIVRNPQIEVGMNTDLENLFVEVLKAQPQIDLFYYGTEDGNFLQASALQNRKSISTKFIDRSGGKPIAYYRYRDQAGQVVRETTSTDVVYDPRLRPWYKKAKATGTTFWTDLYIFFENGKPGITVASPVVDTQGQMLGTIAADMTLDGISAFLREIDVSPNGLVFIMDSASQFVAYPDPARMVKTVDGKTVARKAVELQEEWLTDAVRQYEDSGARRFNYKSGGEGYLAFFTPFPDDFGKDWTIVVLVPEDDFLGLLKQTSKVTLLMSLVILMGAVVFGLIFAKNVSRPIEMITDEVNRIRNFDLSEGPQISSHIKEIQMMSDAVESMRNGLKAFRRFVPADLVRQLIASGEEVVPGGKEQELTMFFSDIAGFTSISESIPARELMVDLSGYFQVMTEAISAEKGTIDKYIGDAVMAFWGAPLADEAHAIKACRAALEGQRLVRMFNQRLLAANKAPFLTRIGLHTGFTIVGNMGSSERLNYTAIGDTVNLASRLEKVNKLYGTEIIISQATYRYVRNDFILRPIDNIAVKGKQTNVLIYELMGDGQSENREELLGLAAGFSAVYGLYMERSWQAALDRLLPLAEQFPDDGVVPIYIDRCRNFLANAPGPDWNGIVRIDS